MRTAKIVVALCLFAIASVAASGRISVYAVIEKVVFEPNEANAERIQLWGAFAFVGKEMFNASVPREATSDPLRGYMYFSLPPGSPDQIKVVRTEWSDLNALAGTGQGVSFGQWTYIGAMEAKGPSGGVFVGAGAPLTMFVAGPSGALTPLQSMRRLPTPEPTPWVTDTGLVKLPAEGSHASTVKKLKDALAK
jgi:hypothetical protein